METVASEALTGRESPAPETLTWIASPFYRRPVAQQVVGTHPQHPHSAPHRLSFPGSCCCCLLSDLADTLHVSSDTSVPCRLPAGPAAHQSQLQMAVAGAMQGLNVVIGVHPGRWVLAFCPFRCLCQSNDMVLC